MESSLKKRTGAGTIALVVLAIVAFGFAMVGAAQVSKTVRVPVQAASGNILQGQATGHVADVELTADDTTVQQIAAGVKFNAWTFDATAPGPVIRVHQGDTVHFTLHNASKTMAHSIDFHAAQTPWSLNYGPVQPGKSFSFDWVARFPGVFMYHCGTPPVIEHIANGMYGAIIVEPATALPAAREYVLVQSELYPAATPVAGVYQGDYRAMTANQPSYVVFNGGANQYKDNPLVARPNELIRLWVVNAGPSHWSAFHVIGALFESAYASGNPANAQHGMQTVTIGPGDGAMLELRIPDPGSYPFVTHSFADTSLGALGIIKIDPQAAPAPTSYPAKGDALSAGVRAAAATAPAAPTGSGATPAAAPANPGIGSVTPGATSTSGSTLSLTAENVKFVPTTMTASAGQIQVTVDNKDPIPHNIAIDTLNLSVDLPPGRATSVTFQAKPGTYTFYCNIPGHRQAGMEGALTVDSSGAH